MICPAPIDGLLDYEMLIDYQYKGHKPDECTLENTLCTTTGAFAVNSYCVPEGLPNRTNYFTFYQMDTIYAKADVPGGLVILDDSGVMPTAPLAVNNQGPNVLASDIVGSSIEIQPIEVCNNDPTTSNGIVGYVTAPNPVQFVDAYSDAAGTIPLVSSLVSDDGQIKKYSVTLPVGSLALGECTNFYIGTTLLYCPLPGSLPPEVCAGASAGCSPEEVRAAIGDGLSLIHI